MRALLRRGCWCLPKSSSFDRSILITPSLYVDPSLFLIKYPPALKTWGPMIDSRIYNFNHSLQGCRLRLMRRSLAFIDKTLSMHPLKFIAAMQSLLFALQAAIKELSAQISLSLNNSCLFIPAKNKPKNNCTHRNPFLPPYAHAREAWCLFFIP